MRTFTKRSVAYVLALLMCVSIVFGTRLPARADNVDYVYAEGYIKNWGTRGTIATFLSQNAEKFYFENDTSYEELASLSGNDQITSVPSSELYLELQDLMQSNHTHITSYEETKELFQYTDCQNSGKTNDKISSFYSGVAIGPAWDGGNTWNREHTWPNSKGLEGDDEDDIMMLRPTSKSENSSRGNKAYGASNDYYDPNKESNGSHNLHGDVARIMLYQYVRWGNRGYMWGSSGVMESKEVLLEWMTEDPVDTWELGRNDSVESITGTRNVFVDYPELAYILFDAEFPEDYITPSGSASSSEHTIIATSNNTKWGNVSVSGRTINTSSADGYEVAGYTIISGNAEITPSGHAFIVKPSSDVTVQINFAPRSAKTVSFIEYNSVVSTQSVYSGEVITLPSHKSALESGHTFLGWVENNIEDTTVTPVYYTAGSKYTVNNDTALYALYSRRVENGDNNGNVFELYSGELTEGDYILVFDNGAMLAEVTSNKRLMYQDVTVVNDTLVVDEEKIIWQVKRDGEHWTIYNESANKYAAGTGSKNQATLISAVTDFARWSASGTEGYTFVNKGNDDKGVNPVLHRNALVGFACYAKNTPVGGPLSLYKRISGTVYYFTGTNKVCTHPKRYTVDAIAPTCTETGYTEGVYCPDCDGFLSGHAVIAALGHNYSGDCDVNCNICDAIRTTNVLHTYGSDNICDYCGEQSDPTAQETKSGDVNNDTAINNKDLGLLMQHLNEWNVTINLNAADVNVDGSINNKDYGLLMQYCNGWDVVLGGGFGTNTPNTPSIGELPLVTDQEKILADAFALGRNETTPYIAQLTGKIVSIDSPYNEQYGNITVTIAVNDKNIQCYKMKGVGVDKVAVGDTITVKGVIKNFYYDEADTTGEVEFTWDEASQTEVIMTKRISGGVVLVDKYAEIMKAAYALAPGESMGYVVALEGKVTNIKNAYDAYYGNITVVIEVADKPLDCFRMVGNGIDEIVVGDTITVTGTIKNYNGTIEFDAGCKMINRISGGVVAPTDSKEIVDEAFALEPGKSLPYTVTLTGEIIKIDTTYDTEYKNITVTIEVEGSDGVKELKCYRMRGDGADVLVVGDNITVTGVIKNYQHSSGDCEVEFDAGCTFIMA